MLISNESINHAKEVISDKLFVIEEVQHQHSPRFNEQIGKVGWLRPRGGGATLPIFEMDQTEND